MYRMMYISGADGDRRMRGHEGNREVKPSYVAYEIITKDDQELSGVIGTETAPSLSIRRAGGAEEVVLRSNVKSLRSSGVSLMPEGIETGLNPQQMADLLQFLQSLKN